MSWSLRSRGGRPRLTGVGITALIAFAAADVLLIALALRHSQARNPETVVAISNSAPTAAPTSNTPTAPAAAASPSAITITPGAAATIASYGHCPGGYATIGKQRVPGVSRVLAATGTTGSIALVGTTDSCTPAVWTRQKGSWKQAKVTVPTGPTGAATNAIWVMGTNGGVVVNSSASVLGRPSNPCTKRLLQLTPTYVAANSGTSAAVFCTTAPTAAGQIRLVYATTDGGKTWRENAGAVDLGPKSKGRKDGLDSDGELVGAGALGAQSYAVLLSGSGCSGVQLRTSTDNGRNWKVGGCLPSAVPSTGIAVSGTAKRIVVAAVTGGRLLSYLSTDGGKTWSAQ